MRNGHELGDLLRQIGVYHADYDPSAQTVTMTIPLDKLKQHFGPQERAKDEPYDQGDWG